MRTARTSNIKHYQLAPWGCKDPNVFEAGFAEMMNRDVIFLPEHTEFQAKPYIGERITPAGIKSAKPVTPVYRWYDIAIKATWDGGWNTEQFATQTFPLRQMISHRFIEQNDWWLYGVEGDRLTHHNDGQRYLIDFGKPGCIDAYCEQLRWRLAREPVDGAMFDYPVYDLPDIIRRWYGPTKALRDYPGADAEWFERAWKPLVTAMSSHIHAIGKKFLLLEPGDYESTRPEHVFNRSKIDGLFYERGLANWWWVHTGDQWVTPNRYTATELAKRIDAIYRDPLNVHWGESFPHHSQLEGGLDAEERYRLAGFCFYLIAVKNPRSADRSYNFASAAVGDDYYPELWGPMNLAIGSPLRKGAKLDATGLVWFREYSKGFVFLNYSGSSFGTDISRLRDATTGEELAIPVVIPAFSGRILLK